MVEAEDFVWSPDSSKVLYVCEKIGEKIMQPAPIQIFTLMILASGKTENWTEGMMGYDKS